MFGPSGIWTMAPLRYAAKFDPFLSLDCAPTPSTLAQSKERRGSNFAIWQHWTQALVLTLVELTGGRDNCDRDVFAFDDTSDEEDQENDSI